MRSTAGLWIRVMYQISKKVWTVPSLHLDGVCGGRAGTLIGYGNSGQYIRSTALAALTTLRLVE